MPQLRPAGRGVAFDGAADRPAELNFNYRVLSTVRRSETKRYACEKLRFSSSSRFDPADKAEDPEDKAEFLERFSLVELRYN